MSASSSVKDDDSLSDIGSDDDYEETGGETDKSRAATEERQSLAKGETRAVRILRIMTLLALLLTAILVSLGFYFYCRKDQEDTFKTEYNSHANKVIESFHTSVEQ
jgi:hypothetical protein